MSYDNVSDPIESISKGATEGFLSYCGMTVKSLAEKFRGKDFSFIEDEKIANLAKDQRKKGEWELFKTYVKNKDMSILFQMGLTLRELEKRNEDLDPLRDKIRKKYKRKGLYIAYFIQNGLFGKFIGNVLGRLQTTEDIKSEVENLLENIEQTVSFVTQYDRQEEKIEEIVTKIRAHSPETFIISGAKSAIRICEEIKIGVMNKVSSNYSSEIYEKEDEENKRIYFLSKKFLDL